MINTDESFLQYAFSKYDNPKLSSVEEFTADIKRFTYLNVLLNRYRLDRLDLKDRLIINHLIILGNCFTVPGLVAMLNYKIQQENKSACDTFMYFIGNVDYSTEKLDFYLLDILNDDCKTM
jgi:hypothetical protein